MRRLRLRAVLTATVAALVVTGCGGDEQGGARPVTAAALDGRTFTSTSVKGHDLVRGTEVEITFEDGAISFSAGCNRSGSSFAVEDGRLRLRGDRSQTAIGCDVPRQQQDEWLGDLFDQGPAVAFDGDDLILTHGDVRIELAAPAADAPGRPPIVGTLWTLTLMVDRKGRVDRLPAGVEPPTLRMVDGGATIFTGCNRGGGAVKVTDALIVFEAIGLTERACPGPATRVERRVTAVLRGTTAYAWDLNDLVIVNAGDQLIFSANGADSTDPAADPDPTPDPVPSP